MKQLSFSVLFIAAAATLGIAVLNMDSFSMDVMIYLIWAVSPYGAAAFIARQAQGYRAVMTAAAFSMFIALGGLWLLVYSFYIHPDAQSALAFVVIPVYQWAVLLVDGLAVRFLRQPSRGN